MGRYYCLARKSGYFLIVDKENMSKAVLSYTSQSHLIWSADFVDIKHNVLRPYRKELDSLELCPPSKYFNTDYVKRHIRNSRPDIDVLPFDIFSKKCEEDGDFASLLVLFDVETLYDRPIMIFVQQSELRLVRTDWVSLI